MFLYYNLINRQEEKHKKRSLEYFCFNPQAAVYYNVFEELREPAFDLTPTVMKETINGFTLRACFRYM